ncbi:MAG: aconitase family protein [Desulfofustis sp.]|jgi:3-isopropylmalate/(R)-2-methylmalate dehydratase large subunit|nr:aconitase family protein [Desulfofustis sp.]
MSEFFYRQVAKAAQRDEVIPGQTVSLKVDLALAHDGTGPAVLQELKERGSRPAGCCRTLFTLDHAFPAPTVRDREFQLELAEFAGRHQILLYRNGEGVLHQVVAEEESLWPGMIIVGADGHVATAGAFGALAFSVSGPRFAEVICRGTYDLSVPEQVVIGVTGRISPLVMARDVAMEILRSHGDLVRGKAVVLTGTAVDQLSISEKMALCNFLPEGGVVTAFVLPQGERAVCDIAIDAGGVQPLVALPGEQLTFAAPETLNDRRISMALIGSCSSGRLEDIKAVAEILLKHGIHPEVTCLITPASRNVLEAMDTLKLSAALRGAGAIVLPPGCGPCPGRHLGLLSAADTAITTTIRANPGRIGAAEADIFLASPLTAAWSAVKGRITGPDGR